MLQTGTLATAPGVLKIQAYFVGDDTSLMYEFYQQVTADMAFMRIFGELSPPNYALMNITEVYGSNQVLWCLFSSYPYSKV